MNLYLSSFQVGDREGDLRRMARGRRLGFVPNALDYVDARARAVSNSQRLGEVQDLGLDVEPLDLADFFDDSAGLAAAIDRFDGVWVRGGNVFVLREAMHRSGFDEILRDRKRTDFLYGGYSAGACVLAPDLEPLRLIDDPTVNPFGSTAPRTDGLAIVDYLVLPHYRSDHPESDQVDVAVTFCQTNGIAHRPLRDGEVIVSTAHTT